MKVHVISVLDTNYVYIVIWDKTCVVIDPGEAKPVLKFIEENNFKLEAILLTHKHADHIGGVDEILEVFPVPIYGGEDEKFPIEVEKAGSQVDVNGKVFKVLKLPGHTEGGVGYYIDGCLFTGDVLFGAGCGYMFEGTALQMTESMKRILALGNETKIYFGHEYTERNLGFAKYMEPGNKSIYDRISHLKGSTTPSTLLLEKQTNPFLRLDESVMIDRINELALKTVESDVDRFVYLRQWKTEFDAGER